MSLLDTFVATFAPHECVGCGYEGKLLCPACTQGLQAVPERCYRCKRLSPGGRTCQSCRASSKLYSVHAATVYEGVARDIVWRLKFHGAQAAAAEIACLLEPHVHAADVMLVHVPTATVRVRRRGYDQARLLARRLSQLTGLPCSALLVRMGQHHQVGAKREQRITQLAHAFRAANEKSIRGAHIVLIDDVLTTGATLEAAANVLKTAGAKRVDGLVFAQA